MNEMGNIRRYCLVLTAALLPIVGVALMNSELAAHSPDGIEGWRCGKYDLNSEDIKDYLTLTANKETGIGSLTAEGIREVTNFRFQGLDRRWNWCLNENGIYNCALIISLDGTGNYYYFGDGVKRAKASEIFECRRIFQ